MSYWDDLVPCKPGDIVRLKNGTTTRILDIRSNFGDTTLWIESKLPSGTAWPTYAELDAVAEVIGHKPLYQFTDTETNAARIVSAAIERVRSDMPWLSAVDIRGALEAKAKETRD